LSVRELKLGTKKWLRFTERTRTACPYRTDSSSLRILIHIRFPFELREHFRQGEATSGEFGGFGFWEVPAAAVVAAEAIGDVVGFAVVAGGLPSGSQKHFLTYRYLGTLRAQERKRRAKTLSTKAVV
jgi:hypothetical protein